MATSLCRAGRSWPPGERRRLRLSASAVSPSIRREHQAVHGGTRQERRRRALHPVIEAAAVIGRKWMTRRAAGQFEITLGLVAGGDTHALGGAEIAVLHARHVVVAR